MAYTNAWSHSIPAGTDAANTLDTIIQQARLDLEQRINTILGSATSMLASDPIVNGTTNKDLTALTTLATAAAAAITTLNGIVNTPASNPFGGLGMTSGVGTSILIGGAAGGWYLVTLGFTAGSGITSLQITDTNAPLVTGSTYVQSYPSVGNVVLTVLIHINANVSAGATITAIFGGGANGLDVVYKYIGPL